MLNKSGLQLNQYGTKQLFKNFCYIMKKLQDNICSWNYNANRNNKKSPL